MEQIINLLEELDNTVKSIIAIDILIRNGNVVSAYRQGVQTIELIKDQEKRKIMGRALLRLRKGEQIDALNDIKSLQDLLKNEKRKILVASLENRKV
jgi:bisphosphoglycerate-independent phosphoglycerate mutase (AlkP superfamily)